MAGRLRQWLQQCSRPDRLRSRQLQTLHNPRCMELIVRANALSIMEKNMLTLGYSITNFNLVIGVVGVFLLIAKVPTHLLRAFYPPLSVVIHGSLVALYMVSARFQAGSDTTDPQHPQPGPPWYITKNCNVAAHKSNIGYCQQAKALFATTIVILCVLYPSILLLFVR